MALGSTNPISSDVPAENAPYQAAPLYYLDNFVSLISTVYALYDDLLTPAELSFYRRFIALDSNAQALLVRLLSRKGDLFRLSKIRYTEIGDTHLATAILLSEDLISEPLSARLDDIFPLFTKAEWLQLLKRNDLKNTPKNLLKEHLAEDDYLLPNVLSSCDDTLVKINCRQIFSTYKLLFFGNGRQDLTDFITVELGITQFEAYRIHKQSRFFEKREQVNSMLSYYTLQEDLLDLKPYDAAQLVSLLHRLPAIQTISGNSYVERVLNRRIQRAHLTVARQLERLGANDAALSIYQHCEQPPSRERQIRILHKQEKTEQACELGNQLLKTGSDAEIRFAQAFLARINKASSRTAYSPTTQLTKPSIKHLTTETLQLATTTLSVEQAVSMHYSQQGTCYYLENQFFLSLFGLVFWPAVFADVPGAFTHKFQSQPHDLYDQQFSARRQAQIASGWKQLKQWLESPEQALHFYRQKKGIANPFISWLEESEQALMLALMLALQRIPFCHWQAIFKRLWHNPKENRNGFPDLVHFPQEGGYQLIEVKGPGDKVQDNQARWFDYFQQHKIPCRVTHVRWL
ncbi:VRR-NUC domain-containing protein [Alteromonadaceae bacterium Bs31]|nr:VRR-NUC domain-containing protein [Alteromonadaceae bacterium Bs31]